MDSPLPPDPYAALGLTSNATASQIKTAYRKLALQCHPDKVQDESLKRQKADEFHKIQQAYDILGDEDQRSKYDAQVRLAELRAEALKRQGASRPVEVRTAYDFRTSRAPSATFEARASSRAYEDRHSPHSYDEYQPYEDSRSSARKFDGYEASSRRPPARSSRASDDARDRGKVDLSNKEKERAERRRARERDTRQDREGKYNSYFEDESEEDRYRYGSDSRRRDDERRREQLLEDRRRQGRLDYHDDTERKMSRHTDTARDYIERSRSGSVEIEARPQPYRSSSTREHEVRRGDSRPTAFVRKSSNRPAPSPKLERRSSPPEIVEWPVGSSRERKHTPKPPPLVTTNSSPSTIKIPLSSRDSPQHAYTEVRPEPPPHPSPLRRAETMPVPAQASPSNRRKESTPVTSSKLRNAETHDSGYSSPGTPEAPQYVETPQSAKSTKYYYSNPNDEYLSKYRQEAFPDESDRRPRQRTPSPIESRYGTDRDATPRASRGGRESSSRYPPPSRSASYATYPAPPAATTGPSTPISPSSQRPKLSRTESSRAAASSPHILRSGGSIGSSGRERLYGEIPSTPRADYSPSSRAEYKNVHYAKPVRAEDARYADYYTGRNRSGSGRRGSESEDYGYAGYGGYRESDREAYRPKPERSATYAYG